MPMVQFLRTIGTILGEFPGKVRSGCVGAGAELIPGPANLHELPGINGEAGNCQTVHEVKRCRQEPLPPVLFELAEDIFHVVFIYEVVVFHNRLRILPFFHQVQDLLLVMRGEPGSKGQGWKGGGHGRPCIPYTIHAGQ